MKVTQTDEKFYKIWTIFFIQTCGLVVRGGDCGCDEYSTVNHVPFTVYPTCIKRSTFDKDRAHIS